MNSTATCQTTIGDVLESARKRLRGAPFSPSTREATLLLSWTLGLGEASILAHPERPLEADELERFERMIARRLTGEPTAYLLGEREFYGRTFRVDDRVLIPRPETEHLIDEVVALDLPAAPRILDIGTGSGAIALTLAHEIEGARVIAVDSSPAAVAVAAENRRRLGLTDRVALVAGDLASGVRLEAVDLVVSNPPYISPAEEAGLSIEVTRFEPRGALFAPPDGLGVVRRILHGLATLRSGAWLLLEIGAGQRAALEEESRQSAFEPVRFVDDYAGIARIAMLRRI